MRKMTKVEISNEEIIPVGENPGLEGVDPKVLDQMKIVDEIAKLQGKGIPGKLLRS